MLRLSLGEDDVVLICAPVEWTALPGSTRGHYCGECGRELWRAPGAPLLVLTDDGLANAPLVIPDPTVLLCPMCAAHHKAARLR